MNLTPTKNSYRTPNVLYRNKDYKIYVLQHEILNQM